jgi:hypothetical protein
MLQSHNELQLERAVMKRTIQALAVTLALVAPAAASAATQTASTGGVTATFTFTGHYPNYKHERLTIERGGTVVYNQPVTSTACGQYCAPGAVSANTSSVHVLDLEQNGSPDVVLDLYTGGAHCCSVAQVFSYSHSSGTYLKTERNFGDPGYEIRLLDGRYRFFTADDRFAYAFTDYAASGLPLQILSFSQGRFSDVTRDYPSLLTRDAAMWLKAFDSVRRQHYTDSVGVVAAWAADEELLGHGTLVHNFLERQAREGHLNSVLNPKADGGQRFIGALYTQLRRDGYVRSGMAADSASIPPCGTEDLGAYLIPGSPGAGQRYATLELMNNSKHSCHTYGHVGLQLLGAHSKRVATDAVWDSTPAAHRIVLAPGAAATAQLHWTIVPGTGDQTGPCVTAPTHIAITPPDETSQLELKWTGGNVCERGRIDVTALVLAPMCGMAADQTGEALGLLSRRRTETRA